jgi:hypothetical protein
VGQSTWEEIDEGVKGANYGWPATEGATANPSFKSPFYAYNHSGGTCAITGAAFYNPATPVFPSDYAGDYFFGDYCAGWIKRIDLGTKAVTDFASGIGSLTDLKIGSDGALYYIARGTGEVRKISYVNSQAPVISQQPVSKTVTQGGNASFMVAATGAAPLGYQWQRNQADIAGATGAAYTLGNVQTGDNGARFRCRVTNSLGSATSNEAVLTVTGNHAPLADITAPAAGATFKGGQAIGFAGNGTDQEDGTLPASAFTWEARLFHNDGSMHSHPAYGPATGSKSGSFTIADQGETSPNIWYRVYLTVKDAQGMISIDSTDIQPVKATVTLAASQSGLQLKLDGTPVTAPFTFTGVVGMKRMIEAVSPQTYQGNTWAFATWSDGGAAVHTLVTPAAAATYTASFQITQSLQAENSTMVGARFLNWYSGWTGTGFADYVNATGDYVEWTVNASSAGSRRLDFRYALGKPETRTLQISVNGTVVNAGLTFTPTANWDTWNLLGVSANLVAGANKVRATAIGTSGPNVDRLEVR